MRKEGGAQDGVEEQEQPRVAATQVQGAAQGEEVPRREAQGGQEERQEAKNHKNKVKEEPGFPNEWPFKVCPSLFDL